jgi:Antitoxin-like ribbon-helix-helix
MGRTLRTQVALYLDADRVELLRRMAEKTGLTQQDLLRQALDALLIRHKLLTPPKRKP